MVDGGHAGVIRGDMVALAGKGKLVMRAVGAGGSLQACESMSQVLGSSVDVPASFSRCGGMLVAVFIAGLTVEVGVICIAVDCYCRLSFVYVAASQVLDLFRASLVFTPCIILSNPSFATRYPSS